MQDAIRHIGELSEDGFFLYDLNNGKFNYINKPFAEIFNSDQQLLLEQPRLVLPFIRSEDSFYLKHRYKDLIQDKTISNAEFRLHYSNGVVKHLACDAYLINDAKYIAGIVKDYTKNKEHEDYIVNYGAKKDTLLDMMTHNLSGPLNLSQNILRWMQQTYKDKMPGEIYSELHLIQSNIQECLDIINDFLREEHMESERIYVKKSRFDVLDRIMATLEKMVATNKNKKFRLLTDLQNLDINTDSVKFFQIIHNLVSNAIKFTPDGGEIDIIVKEMEKTFIISVRDNGIGIPKELQARLFDKRTPSGRDGLNKEASTGMGLHIVQMLVTLLEGRVWFESEDGKGSTFSIELPKE
ncbi:MAG TPA: HAMP domain-containing sensor histidine kinase [Chitinophagaceae bacterium]